MKSDFADFRSCYQGSFNHNLFHQLHIIEYFWLATINFGEDMPAQGFCHISTSLSYFDEKTKSILADLCLMSI